MTRVHRSLTLAAAVGLAHLFPDVSAQERQDPDAARAAVAAWLDSEHDDEKLLDSATEAVLDAGRRGFALVQKRYAATEDRHRRAAIVSLITRIALGFLNREGETGLVYAGQYDPLEPLMPEVGRLFLNLVIATPDWFPDDMRAGVVPALRDLYPKGPDQGSLEALVQIARDEEFESEQLRVSLGYALYQWGHRDLVKSRIDELTESAGERETADELYFVRHLAHVYYLVRDYDTASKTWIGFLRATEALDDTPSALDYYNAGCCLSLAGRIESALEELERCATRFATGPRDSTIELTREMFRTDPDLRVVRSTKRFEALVERAFPKKKDGDDELRR